MINSTSKARWKAAPVGVRLLVRDGWDSVLRWCLIRKTTEHAWISIVNWGDLIDDCAPLDRDHMSSHWLIVHTTPEQLDAFEMAARHGIEGESWFQLIERTLEVAAASI